MNEQQQNLKNTVQKILPIGGEVKFHVSNCILKSGPRHLLYGHLLLASICGLCKNEAENSQYPSYINQAENLVEYRSD